MVVDLQCNWHRGISIVSKQLNHMNCDLGRAGKGNSSLSPIKASNEAHT